ncbi:hypothetical protein YC2023_032535 [Brassica napus]
MHFGSFLVEHREKKKKLWKTGPRLDEILSRDYPPLKLRLGQSEQIYKEALVAISLSIWRITALLDDKYLSSLKKSLKGLRDASLARKILNQASDIFTSLNKLRSDFNRDITLPSSLEIAGRLKSFNDALEEMCKKPSTWVISEKDLRERVCQQIVQGVVPVYRSYGLWRRFLPLFTYLNLRDMEVSKAHRRIVSNQVVIDQGPL